MAVTADLYAPFATGAGANSGEETWREIFKGMASSGVFRGVLDGLQPYASGAVLQIKVKTGECYIRGHWARFSSEKTLTVAANATAFARKDLIVARLRADTDLIEVDIVTGVAAATPLVPALTQNTNTWEIKLGVLDVPAGDSTIEAGQCVSARQLVSQRSAVHQMRSVGLTVTINNAVTDYVTIAFTPHADCYLDVSVVVGAQADAGASGDAAEPCAFLLGYKIQTVSPLATVFTSDQLFAGEAIDYNLLGLRGKSETPIVDAPNIFLTGGTAYQFVIFGNKSSALGGKIQHVIGRLAECIRTE